MYYLYRHIRLDKNEVFYIGIGTMDNTKKTLKSIFRRAFERIKSRSEHWKNIINKTEYKVEIIYVCKTQKEIIAKEIEFIDLYKPIVCNLTEGRLGITSYKHNANTKKSISATMKGRKCTQEHINNMNKRKLIPIEITNIATNKKSQFNSIKEALIFIAKPAGHGNVNKCLRGLRKSAYGYKFEKL